MGNIKINFVNPSEMVNETSQDILEEFARVYVDFQETLQYLKAWEYTKDKDADALLEMIAVMLQAANAAGFVSIEDDNIPKAAALFYTMMLNIQHEIQNPNRSVFRAICKYGSVKSAVRHLASKGADFRPNPRNIIH